AIDHPICAGPQPLDLAQEIGGYGRSNATSARRVLYGRASRATHCEREDLPVSCTEQAFAGRARTSPSCRRALWHGDSKYVRHSAAHLVPPLPSTYRPGDRKSTRLNYSHEWF